MIEKIETSKAPKAVGPYSQAILLDNLIFVSGQIAIDPEKNAFDDKLPTTDQFKTIIKNIENILIEAGSSLEKVVKVEIFLTDLSVFKSINELYKEYFCNEPLPARTTIEVSKLPLGANIEISCVGYIN